MEATNLTLLKDHLKTIAIEILEHERDKKGVREDMVDLKAELKGVLPKGLIPKVIKVYLQKGGIKDVDLEEYQQACRVLGIGYNCEKYIPSEVELTAEQKEIRKRVISICERYSCLNDEANQLSVDIRDCYAKARAIGISVPLLKKLVDFVLHPDKLRAYHDDTPLLEAYVEVIPDIE